MTAKTTFALLFSLSIHYVWKSRQSSNAILIDICHGHAYNESPRPSPKPRLYVELLIENAVKNNRCATHFLHASLSK